MERATLYIKKDGNLHILGEVSTGAYIPNKGELLRMKDSGHVIHTYRVIDACVDTISDRMRYLVEETSGMFE